MSETNKAQILRGQLVPSRNEQLQGVTLEMSQDWVTFEPLYPDVEPPARATAQSAGYDVKAHVSGREIKVFSPWNQSANALLAPGELTLLAGERALVPLGFKATLPEGWVAQLHIRSGTALKKGLRLANGVGIIDADFPDEWMAIVHNTSAVPVTIEHGERIAQVVFSQFLVPPFVLGRVVSTTERNGGFGSTNKR